MDPLYRVDLYRPQGQELEDLTSRQYDPSKPVLVGHGPAEFSTSLALEPWPSIVWDTNRYYAHLDVHQKADRRSIRQAYMRQRGYLSPRLTMVMHTLLNPEHRLRYDLVPFGALFWDTEIEEAQRRQLVDAATEAILAGEELEDDLNDVLEEMRNPINDDFEYAEGPARYQWSYYLWESKCLDVEKLYRWRHLVSVALHGDAGSSYSIGIGFHGFDENARVARVGNRVVLLVSDKLEPTEIVAENLALQVVWAFIEPSQLLQSN